MILRVIFNAFHGEAPALLSRSMNIKTLENHLILIIVKIYETV